MYLQEFPFQTKNMREEYLKSITQKDFLHCKKFTFLKIMETDK